MKTQLLLALCLGAGLLTACGGGGSDHPDVPPAAITEVPASATVSAEAYTAFGVGQAMNASDTDEPLSVDTVTTPPTSETAEPVAL